LWRYSTIREILDIANDMPRDLFKAGAMDKITMRQVRFS
jgi:hypothetical protein